MTNLNTLKNLRFFLSDNADLVQDESDDTKEMPEELS